MTLAVASLAAMFAISPRPVVKEPGQPICLCKFIVPPYSLVARSARMQGIVRVKVGIDSDGVPQGLTVLETPHVVLSGDAVRALKEWRFCPSSAKSGDIIIAFHFKLEGATTDWSPTIVSFDPSGEMDITTTAINPEREFDPKPSPPK